MKKTLLICLVILILGLAIVIPIPVKILQNKKINTINDTKQVIDIKAKTLENVIEYDGETPKFKLKVSGLDSLIVDNNEIKGNIPLYQFDAWIYDIYGTNKNTYVGFKYVDLINYLSIAEYNSATFISNRKSVFYRSSELYEDKTYIVFYKDGKKINDTDLTLLSINYRYGNSVEGLTEINFN